MQVKELLKDSFFEVLKNIEPNKLISNKCEFKDNQIIINKESITLPKDKKIHLFGSGKAVLSMAKSIFENFNPEYLHAYSSGLMEESKAEKVLCGWVNIDKEDYTAFLYLVTKEEGLIPHTIKEINSRF